MLKNDDDCSLAPAGAAMPSDSTVRSTTERSAPDTSDPQVRGEDVLVVELRRFSHELNPALLQDVHVVGQFERSADVLLDEEERHSLSRDLVQVLEDLVHQLG